MLLERDLAPPKVALPVGPDIRVRRAARRVAIAVVALFGALLLLRHASTIGRGVVAVTHANPLGLALAGLLVATTYVAAAVAITAASGRALPLGRTTAVQLAAVCTNRIAPAGLGAMATNARFLEYDGASRSQALTAVGLSTIASFVAHAIVTMTVLVLVHRPVGALLHPPAHFPALASLVVVSAVTALVVFLAQRFAPRVVVHLREGRAAVASICVDPRRLGRLLFGAIGVTLGHGLAFVAAVGACGVHLPITSLLAVFLAGSAIGSTAPTPGGLGALEAALVAGLTALGAPAAPAVAGVLSFRLITYWLPIIPSAVALKLLGGTAAART